MARPDAAPAASSIDVGLRPPTDFPALHVVRDQSRLAEFTMEQKLFIATALVGLLVVGAIVASKQDTGRRHVAQEQAVPRPTK
jgi:hypothetical protein